MLLVTDLLNLGKERTDYGIWPGKEQFFKKNGDKIVPWNTLDEIHTRNINKNVETGIGEMIIPPHVAIDDGFKTDEQKLKDRLNDLSTPQDIVQLHKELKDQGFDPGMPISVVLKVGDDQYVAFQRYLLRIIKDGKIQPVLIGYAAQAVGIIPKEAQLEKPVLDKVETRFIPSTRGERPGKVILVGKATYYSQSGCVGCSPNQVMRNGEIYNQNAYTIAGPVEYLNRWVIITNPKNGRSVRARITDTGGFGKYGFVADLSLAVRNALGGQDITDVIISLVD